MELVAVALAILAVGLVLDLLLSVGLVRRFRSLGTQLSAANAQITLPLRGGIPAGEPVPLVEALTEEGESWAVVEMRGRPFLMAFFESQCGACRGHLEELSQYASSAHIDRNSIVAVVAGDRTLGTDLIDGGARLGRVIVEADARALSERFQIRAYPTFFVIGAQGQVEKATHSIIGLPKDGWIRDGAGGAVQMVGHGHHPAAG